MYNNDLHNLKTGRNGIMNKLKIAVIGGGRVGASHMDGIIASQGPVELAGIVDLNKELADKTAEEYNIKRFYSIEEAINDNSLDAFIVCLPHHLHYPVGKQLLEAKKHVLMEKPLAINIKEVESLINIARKNGVTLMSAQSRRYFKAVQDAKASLPEIDGPTNMLYTFAPIFTRESAPPWWQEDKKTGGLVLGMVGSHTIDLTLWMFENRSPVTLYCETRSISDVFEGDDAATVTIKFDDGTIATNYMSISNNPIRHDCLIEGRKGSIYFEHFGDHDGTIGAASTDLYVNGEKRETQDEPNCFTLQVTEFANAIAENRQPLTSGENVYLTYLLIEAARESARTNQPINLGEYLKKTAADPVLIERYETKEAIK
jgi:predicted dehydrogenase